MPDNRGGYGSANRSAIINACVANWDRYQKDCSGFLKAVVEQLNKTLALRPPVKLTGLANELYDQLTSPPWQVINNSDLIGGDTAMQIAGIMAATEGNLVVAAKQENRGTGHVAIVVDFFTQPHIGIQPAAIGRAVAYWGRHSEAHPEQTGMKYREISQSWSPRKQPGKKSPLEGVTYCYYELPKDDAPRAGSSTRTR